MQSSTLSRTSILNMTSARLRPRSPLLLTLILSLMACLTGAPVRAQSTVANPGIFTIGLDAPPGTYVYKWVDLVYSEAFKRLGIPVRLESYSLKRQGLQMEAGSIDAEANRAFGYAATQPHLIRIEQSMLELQLALFAAHPAVQLHRLEELSNNGLLVEYRRGLLLCENALKPLVAADRLSDIATEDQGLKKLQVRRTDLYCDFTLTVALAMRKPELKVGVNVRKVMDVGQPILTYPYLHKKHAELAPRLTAVLKAMKAEDLMEAYRLQVEQELGLPH